MKNKHVLIVEHNMNQLNIVNEKVANTEKLTIGGIFTEFDIENRNKRFYTAENFIPCMDALLAKKALLGVVYGELDHPEGFDISGKNASHVIESLYHNKENNRVDGSISILTTPNGNIIRNILNDGYPVFVSSRAAGITGPNNLVALKELFTYDGVLDPGFASTRQSVVYESLGYNKDRIKPINESLGYNDDIEVPYRIYDLSESLDLENLVQDNKNNDKKTLIDLTRMEKSMENELEKIEQRILESVKNSSISPDEIKQLQEKYTLTIEQLEGMKKYMDFFKKNYNSLVKENKQLKKELNENTEYSNHLSNGLKNLQKDILNVNEKLDIVQNDTFIIGSFAEQIAEHTKSEIEITQKFVEHVAENAKSEIDVTQKFAEHIAENAKSEIDVTQKFAEQIAEHTKSTFAINEQFVEYIAEQLKANNVFTEYTAKEIEVTQGLLEHIAHEYKKDNYYISYIAEKVEGTKDYVKNVVNSLKDSTPVNESIETSIHNIDDIDMFLGLDEENKLINSIQNNIEEAVELDEIDNLISEFSDLNEDFDLDYNETDDVVSDDTMETEETDIVSDENSDENADEIPVNDIDATTDFPVVDTEITSTDVVPDGSLETSILSSLVNILGTDDTGIVIEITPDNKLIIQKSGSDETVELGQEEIEVIDTDDNIVESVSNLLANVKKVKAQANKQPHFFTFLSEKEIIDFKCLNNNVQNEIISVMETATYFNEQDVLRLIGETINKDTMTYEQKIINAIPERLKDTWNNFDKNVKDAYIAESTFFKLTTTADIISYWNTRDFSKKLDSGITIINESIQNNDSEEFSPEFIEAFRKSALGK